MSDETEIADGGGEPAGRMPPATFEFLIHTLFTQALMAFGRIPNPITNKAVKNIPTARHFIDTLDMLEAKTQGNLSADERKLLEEIQHQLRMLYMEERA
jgi:tellurite resistance protein